MSDKVQWSKCPHCQGFLQFEDGEKDADTHWDKYFCVDCGFTFEEIYLFSYNLGICEDGSLIQFDEFGNSMGFDSAGTNI